MSTPSRPVSLIAPVGEYDVLQQGWLVSRVLRELAAGSRTIEVDLDGLDYGGAALVNDLVHCHHECDVRGARLDVTASDDSWHRLFTITGTTHLLAVA